MAITYLLYSQHNDNGFAPVLFIAKSDLSLTIIVNIQDKIWDALRDLVPFVQFKKL